MNIMKTKLSFVLVFALLLLSVQGIAQTDRSKQPAPGPAPKTAFPDFYETTLSNGLKVLVITNDKEPVVNFRLMIKSGSEYDGKNSGTGDFTTSLLTKGTTTRSSLEFATEADFLGIDIGANAGDDNMSLNGSGLKKHTNKILELMTDALLHPTFPEDELEKARKQTLSGLVSEKKNPESISSRLEIFIGYNDNPYSNFQTEESVKNITRDDIVNFHKTYFIPNNASLAVVGDVKPDEIIPVVKKYFEAWQKGTAPSYDFPAPKPVDGHMVHMVDLGSTQTQTNVSLVTTGIPRNHEDYMPFTLANSILGGGFSGRLFANLREKHGFTYGAYSSIDSRKNAGLWTASASVRRVATDSSIFEILHEMKRMQDTLVTQTDLGMHKQYMSGTFLLSLENPGTTATRLQSIDLFNLPKNYYKNFVTNLMKVTPADVQRIAKTYMTPEKVAITAVGDAAAIKESLEKFGAIQMYDTDMHPVKDSPDMNLDMDAETLMQKHIKAMGGEETYAKIKDRIMAADVSMNFGPQSIEGSTEITNKAPNKSYELQTFSMGAQVMTSEKWNNGTRVVQTNPMSGEAKALEGEELAAALEEDLMDDFVRYKELGYELKLTTKKMVDGKPVYTLVVKRKHGSSTMLISADDFMLVGKDETKTRPEMGSQSISTRFSDYKVVDGIMLPYKIDVDAGQVSFTIKVTSYKQNIGVKDDVFEKK